MIKDKRRKKGIIGVSKRATGSAMIIKTTKQQRQKQQRNNKTTPLIIQSLPGNTHNTPVISNQSELKTINFQPYSQPHTPPLKSLLGQSGESYKELDSLFQCLCDLILYLPACFPCLFVPRDPLTAHASFT